MNTTTTCTPVVLIVDDNDAVRAALSSLLRSAGFDVAEFASLAQFAEQPLPNAPRCLLLDIHLQNENGLDLQAALNRSGIQLPIVFMTGNGDIQTAVRAMKAGAVDFLTKPLHEEDVLAAIEAALKRDELRRSSCADTDQLASRFAKLTPREREIMGLATTGLMNKQIAGHVGTSEITVKKHRANARRKMGAKTFADLVRMAQSLGLERLAF